MGRGAGFDVTQWLPKSVLSLRGYGRKQFLRVEQGFLAATGDHWFLPVGVVGIDDAQKLALVELPHEADSGVSRLWVRQSELRELNGAVA